MPRRSRVSAGPRGDGAPISASEAARLFAELKTAGTLVLAVSGGPDSTALMLLAARWRERLKNGPKLLAVTIDHGLRKESAAEARAVKKLAATLHVPHTTLRWSGTKPARGLPANARQARYEMLAEAARKSGAVCILTAHTRDDQAETFLMRVSRGSGLAGLAAMAPKSTRGDVMIMRPFLDVPKSRLVATLVKARIEYADDPTNSDATYTRPRFRQLMPELAREGLDARNISRLAARLARANTALDVVADRADRVLVQYDGNQQTLEIDAFRSLPHEIRLRLLQRTIQRSGYEGTVELGKLENLLDELMLALSRDATRVFRRTLAGALVSTGREFVAIEPAPPRRTQRTRS